MQIITTKAAMREAVRGWRATGESLALVPMRGPVHAGKRGLIGAAREAGAGRVVVALPCGGDPEPLRAAGVDAVFAPDPAEWPAVQTTLDPGELARILLGKSRPMQFREAATNAARLFTLMQPDFAVYGERDYQQVIVIRQMVRDLDFPLQVLGVPVLREADGLVIASANARLTPEDRAAAPLLSRALAEARELAKTGLTASRLRSWVAATLQAEPRAELPTADIRDAATLASVSGPLTAQAVILLSARFGKVTLHDHILIAPTA